MIQQEIPIIESVDIQTEIAFNNLCLQDGGGKEQRVILWQDPIRTFNLHKEIVYPVQLTALREFFDLTKGSLESFFYRDKSDWQASRVKELRSDVQTYGTLYGLGNNEYQACKAYQVGSTIYLRPIACPFNLALFNGETVVTGWTLGNNGKVTFSGTFNGVSFDFYVPVRFETDDLERQITAKSEPDNYVVYSIPKLVLKEVKIDFDDNVVDTFQKDLDHTLSLDLLKGSEVIQYQTDILSQESGFEKRSLVQETPTVINNLQARNIIYQDDIEYLIALWLCVKGEGASFYFDNGFGANRGRFASKALSYTCQSNSLVYSLASLQVKDFGLFYYAPRFLRFLKVYFTNPGHATNGYVENAIQYSGPVGGYDTPFTVGGFHYGLASPNQGIVWGGPIINGVEVTGGYISYISGNFVGWGFFYKSYNGVEIYQVARYERVVLVPNQINFFIQLPATNLSSIDEVRDEETGFVYTLNTHYTAGLVEGRVNIIPDTAIADSTGLEIRFRV